MNAKRSGLKLVAALGILGAAAWTTVWAQGLGPSSAGSLAELTAEVRQLRSVIQEAARGQTQIQAFSISLTAQQSRLSQVSARLDRVEDELQVASTKALEATKTYQETESTLARATTAEDRAYLQNELRGIKPGLDKLVGEENRIRQRQMDLMASFRAEEVRWLELVAKLEELIKR